MPTEPAGAGRDNQIHKTGAGDARKKGRIDINAELKEGMIASFIKGKRLEMFTVAMTMTKSISHNDTDRKAFAVRRVQARHVLHEDVLRAIWFLSTVQGFRNSQPRNLNVFLYWFRAAGQKNNGNYNDNSSIVVSFQGGIMFLALYRFRSVFVLTWKVKHPAKKSLPRKEGPTNIVSLGPQERENLEKKLDVIRDMRDFFPTGTTDCSNDREKLEKKNVMRNS